MADPHPAVAAAVAAAAGGAVLAAPPPAAAAGGAAGGAVGGGLQAAGSGGFGQLGPQLPALRVLQLRRLPSSCPPLWQLAPGLTSLVVWAEANNAGLTR